MIPSVNVKMPQECADISEVRHEIDQLDRAIIELLSTRLKYVREVVKFKEATHSGIEATDRRNAVIESRKAWACQVGLDSEVVGEIYDRLIQYCIQEEKKLVL